MKIIERKSAMKAFYYLIAVDGEINDDKLNKFLEIGHEIDGEAFDEYKEVITDECGAYLKTATGDDDFYDIIQEGIDEELQRESNDISEGIPARLLVWDMLAIAFSNDEYSDTERRIISHVVRTAGMDKSVFLEMEQLIKTAASVNRENAWIQTSDKPYAKIRPIVEELEKRQRVINECAKALIEDEIESDDPYVEESKSGLLDGTKAVISEKVNPIASEISKKTRTAADEAKKKIGETVNPTASEIKAGANRVLGKISAKIQKNSDSSIETAEVGEDDKTVEKE